MTPKQQKAKGLTFNRHKLAAIEIKLIEVCPHELQEKLYDITSRELLDPEKDYLALWNLVPANESCSGIWFAWSQLCEQWKTTALIIKELEEMSVLEAITKELL